MTIKYIKLGFRVDAGSVFTLYGLNNRHQQYLAVHDARPASNGKTGYTVCVKKISDHYRVDKKHRRISGYLGHTVKSKADVK